MKTIFSICALALVFVGEAFGRNAPIEETLKSADSIAYVQVVSVSEDLKDGAVTHRATLNIVGRSHALKDGSPFEVQFGSAPASDSPFFILGKRSIVVLKLAGAQLRVLRQIYVSDDGKIEEPRVFQSLGFDRGADANFAVDCMIAAMKKEPNQASEPTAAAGRGSP